MAGMRKYMPSFADFDLFPRIPAEFLREPTSLGSLLSAASFVVLLVLCSIETMEFMSPPLRSQLVLDKDAEDQIRINFNISMLELNCDHAVVDIKDSLGLNRANATVVTQKWRIGANGRLLDKKAYHFTQEREAKASKGFVEDLLHHAKGFQEARREKRGIPQAPQNLNIRGEQAYDELMRAKTFFFVFFYVPRCPYCVAMTAEWDDLILRAMTQRSGMTDITVAKVECTHPQNRVICNREKIRGVPTMRLFRSGRKIEPDYWNTRRDVVSWLAFLTSRGAASDGSEDAPQEGDGSGALAASGRVRTEADAREHARHVGCMLVGAVIVNRVPGNFHIEARAVHGDRSLRPEMANLSHVVNYLYFGAPLTKRDRSRIGRLPPELSTLGPLDGGTYVDRAAHKVHHHYIKAVASEYYFFSKVLWANIFFPGRPNRVVETYQVLGQSTSVNYADEGIPEAKFNYDVHPVGIKVQDGGHFWYEYLTSLLGVLGGTFTLLRFLHYLVDTGAAALKKSRAFGTGSPGGSPNLSKRKVLRPVEATPAMPTGGLQQRPQRTYMSEGK